jgi:DNA-binding response OmpR family regulator
MSRILICESRRSSREWCRNLAEEGHDTVVCTGREALFDALATKRPDVIVYALGDLTLDLGVLWVVRRMAPTLPIILLGGPAGLDVRRSVQELKPAYFGMFPLEPAELSDAVRSVLRHDGGRALAS